MYRQVDRELKARGFNTMSYDDHLYAERGLLVCIISKVDRHKYRVEVIDSGNDIVFVSRCKYAKGVIECIEEQAEYFVLTR